MKAAPPKLVLASSSPRRAQLLRQLRLDFDQIAADVDESQLPNELPAAYTLRLAQLKAEHVAEHVRQRGESAAILGSDTCISLDDCILGKPENEQQAQEFLARLAGRKHTVYSSVYLIVGGQTLAASNCSEVWMQALTAEQIRDYCKTGEPLDKAGAYAIQGLGAIFIERIAGSYSGIMGLPLFETSNLLRQVGFNLLRMPS